MFDSITEEAVRIVEGMLEESRLKVAHRRLRYELARDTVIQLQQEGLIARCSCAHGFGQVRNPNCPAHGTRVPAHTISGPLGSEP